MRAWRIPAALAFAAGWVALAWLLLDTAVPGGLDLPDVDVDSTFGADVVREAESFERVLRGLWLASQVALVAVLWVYARRGAVLVRESAAGRIGTGMLLGMLGLGILWFVQIPFDVAAFWWLRRHDLYEGSIFEYVIGSYLALGAAFLSISLALVLVMALAGVLGDWWWIPGAAVFVALGAFFTFLMPYLVTEQEPLDDPQLEARVEEYERAQGVSGIPVRIEVVSDVTSQPNAYAVGLGPSRRVFLWDTLVYEYDEPEVNAVLAHELAHHSSEHLPKGIAWFALFAFPGAWVVARVTRRRGGMAQPEAVPLALLTVAVIQLVTAPATAWISRRMEAEADWKALQTTRDPDGARGLFVGFASDSLGDPSPPAWAHVLLDSHPTLEERVAMAEAWAERTGVDVSRPTRPVSGSARLLPASVRVPPGTATTVELSAFQLYEARADGGGGVRRMRESPATEYEPRLSRGGLLFVSEADGDADVYVARPDGTAPRRLTDSSAVDYDPSWSPDGGRIAWVRVRDGSGELWVMRADGSGARRLPDPGDAQNPVWSPDGSRLAFWTVGDEEDVTWVVGADGSGLQRVIAGTFPSWAPDGKRLVVEGDDGLVVVGIDGKGRRALRGTDFEDTQPAWSPRGDRIAFVRARDEEDGDLWTVSAEGGEERRVTSGDADDFGPAWTPDGRALTFTSDRDANSEVAVGRDDGRALLPAPSSGWDGDAAWSPDGRRLVFVSDRTGDDELWAVDGAGGGLERLTRRQGFDGAPDWGPGGIVYARGGDEDEFGFADEDVWVMDADGADQRKLAGTGEGWDGDPAWSPDGALVAFSSSREDYSQLYVVRADGSGLRRVTSAEGESDGPAWSPDGKRLAFESDRSGPWEIWVVDVEGGAAARQVTRGDATAEYPHWSPDGAWIAYSQDAESGLGSEVRVVRPDGSGDRQAGRGTSQWLPQWRPR